MKLKNWMICLALAAVAALVYFPTLAGYAYPGESAHLLALWKGLDSAAVHHYPFLAALTSLFGAGNWMAPIFGIVSVLLVYLNVAAFTSSRVNGDRSAAEREPVAAVAGITAALVFLFTPAVHLTATHFEPRLFDVMWALIIASVFIPLSRASKGAAFGWSMLVGAMAALGCCDSALFIALLPLVVMAMVLNEVRHGRKPYLAVFLFVVAALVTFLVAKAFLGFGISEFFTSASRELRGMITRRGWVMVALFSTLPFLVTRFTADRAYGDEVSVTGLLFHAAMSVAVILAVATPLAPSSLMRLYGLPPVMTSLFAAVTAGYVLAYWYLRRTKPMAIAAGAVLAFVLAFSCFWEVFSFDSKRGAFADATAERILDDLGGRSWLVTDGRLDDHLLLKAAERGRELNLISLTRDSDETYLEALGRKVAEKRIGGSRNADLVLSLSLGVLPFVQDWFSCDASIAGEAAVFGAADLWLTSGLKPVPEFLFFGADADIKVSAGDADYARFLELYADKDAKPGAKECWGSYGTYRGADPVDQLKFSLRRHLGMIANNRGVWLQDAGDNDGAFAMYERVLGEIDRDNVCSIFNEVELAGAKHPKAEAKRRELERRLKEIADNKNRRYDLMRLTPYYGYIRNPEMFVRLGFSWARSGRAGEALAQLRRAIDFVPGAGRLSLLNMMAALYANENDHVKSRRIYASVLEKNGNDHDALVGMMRLELLEGEQEKAVGYLERAVAASPAEARRTRMESAMLAMMKNDLGKAIEILRKLADEDPKDLQSLSMLAAATMQRYDAEKDEAAKKKILEEISTGILPAMEKRTKNPLDYNVQITRAFLLLRQGDGKRREARDAFVAATKSRPDSAAAHEMALGLDISLDDRENAERRARDILRRNRNAPLANYVMGSLSIRRGEYVRAEQYLRKAADVARPNLLALNDLAEVLRRTKKYTEAERYARLATEKAPEMYIAWETLGTVLMEAGRDLDEAEKCIRKSIELSSKDKGQSEDIRLYTSLARVQVARGDRKGASQSLRKIRGRANELTDFEKTEYEEILKRVQ